MPKPRRSIPVREVLGYLENLALILDGLGEIGRHDPAIREAMTTASASVREAGAVIG